MKLRDRYPQLQDPALVKAMVVRSVYASMALENQAVFGEWLEALYVRTATVAAAAACCSTDIRCKGPCPCYQRGPIYITTVQ
jgi:hypothetical protein